MKKSIFLNFESFKPHDHICHICYNVTERREIGAKFIAYGIKNTEKSIIIKSNPLHSEFYDRLQANGININEAHSNGFLYEFILKDANIHDINSLLHVLDNVINPPNLTDYKTARILYIEDSSNNENLLLKESRINEFCKKSMVLIMHQYETKYLNSENIIDLLRTHEYIILENLLHISSIFTSYDEILKNFSEEVPDNKSLTNREKIILRQLVEGHTNKRISRELGISVRTVEAHRNNIMKKLNARTIVDVVRFALQHKMIQ